MASTGHITPNVQTANLMALGTSPAGPLHLHMVSLAAKVETQAKRNASGAIVKVQTGNLRSTIHTQILVRGTMLVGQVNADAAYALWVHDGTKPHDIVPTRAKVLTWTSSEGRSFATKVRHPGTKGRPFLRNALSAIQ